MLNGSNADGEVAGIIYVPGAEVTDQRQLQRRSRSTRSSPTTFKINGNGGTIKILKRVGVDAIVTAAGLVD